MITQAFFFSILSYSSICPIFNWSESHPCLKTWLPYQGRIVELPIKEWIHTWWELTSKLDKKKHFPYTLISFFQFERRRLRWAGRAEHLSVRQAKTSLGSILRSKLLAWFVEQLGLYASNRTRTSLPTTGDLYFAITIMYKYLKIMFIKL